MQYQRTDFRGISAWVLRVLRLDFSVFDEVRSEPSATLGAIVVVFGASLLAGVGSWLWAVQNTDLKGVDGLEVFVKSLLVGSVIQTAVWFAWVYFAYQVLVRVYAVNIHFSELTRVMGYAFAPVALNILVALAPLAVPFGVLSYGMALLFTNAAIQQAAGVEYREAIPANVAGFAVFLVVMGVFANIAEVGPFGGLAPGLLFFSLDF